LRGAHPGHPGLADADSYSATGHIVRLGFGGLNFWTLPVMAHEVGHLYTSRHAVFPPTYSDASRTEQLRSPLPGWNEWQTDELCADVLGACLGGLAYGFAHRLASIESPNFGR
jgi:hypothetical protein